MDSRLCRRNRSRAGLKPVHASLASFLLASTAFAQTPAFEAADVHLSERSSMPAIEPFNTRAFAGNQMKSGFARGLYIIRAATMTDLIGAAYGVATDNVTGGPNWLDTDRFDVTAKAPTDSSPEALRKMLQALLADRFGLAVRSAVKPLPVYLLSAGPHPMLKQATGTGSAGCRSANARGTAAASTFTTYSCRRVDMAAFVDVIHTVAATYTGATPVLDRTGLKDAWDFDIHWTPKERLVAAGAEGVSFFDAIDKQLGLKLEKQQVPTPVVEVDRVNRAPSANPPDVAMILPAVPTEFEVASVRPSLKTEPDGGGAMPGGRIEMNGNTIKDLIKFAWNIDDADDDTLVGGPKWLDDDRFTILAKASVSQLPTGQLIDAEALRPMMKSLLLNRFKLKVHYGEAPIQTYALEVAKRSTALMKADPSRRMGCRNVVELPGTAPGAASVLTSHFECHNTTMAQLTEQIRDISGGFVDHPVVDTTGLDGAWDFSMSFSSRRAFRAAGRGNSDPAAGPTDPTGAVSFFDALEKQLGLKSKLQQRKMPVLIVDSVERTPTEN